MHIDVELDEIHSERLMRLQQRLNKPLTEIAAEILARAVDETILPNETEGSKILKIMEKHGILGCMEGEGTLSVDYKKHLWGTDD
ncbi:MAG: hypothetical protein Q8L79_15385 [Methylobacter sp.]|uniref:hypothetical protein n=1 Tax=Methylobacter sp. TaxID=2051955 RepID=UPI0027315CA7|nr:hypothetical protein [Methylobacter sp.]MDP1666491.1 hypothetical protein [Methylobacter sp.]MDP1970039.1 hypothetical protein [Methylobacter sp.]